MADDGTGGVAYTRFEEGATHVYAARYDGVSWHPAQRVDAGQRFNAWAPRIGAADGGRLVVTWVQQGPPNRDAISSSVLPLGATRFLPPTLVDVAVGDGTKAFPTLAMSSGGQALLAYHRVTPTRPTEDQLGPEYVTDQVRVARFNGSRWSGLGTSMTRLESAPPGGTFVRVPTAATAPRVAIGEDGGAIVAWQEPDEQLIDRVWVRRIFGDRRGVVQPAGAREVAGRPERGAATAFDVAATDNGRAVVAVRQEPDPERRQDRPRIWLGQLDEPESGSGAAIGAPKPIGEGAASPPSVAVGGRFGLLTAWASGGRVRAGQGSRDAVATTLDLGPGLAAPSPVAAQGIDDRGVVAAAVADGGGRVRVHELRGATVASTQDVAARAGGPVAELAIAGPGNGNALVAFRQGGDDEGQIAVARVSAPPVPFLAEPPDGWTNLSRPVVTWTAPPNDPAPAGYLLRIDGRTVRRTTGARRATLPAGALRDGRHEVRVVAVSRTGGGQTWTPLTSFGVDRRPPRLRLERRGRQVVVRASDPGGKRASKLVRDGTTVTWDGGEESDLGTGVLRHRYAKPGRYRLEARTHDQAGNVAVLRRTVVVPRTRDDRRRARR